MNFFQSTPVFVKYFLADKTTPVTVSIDITSKCNLRCKHCYFMNYGFDSELGEEEMLTRLKGIKEKYPIIQASWIGGEPLLRKDLVEKGMKLFPFNMVVTNGTINLPSWKNCVFNVSVDGTKEHYERVRGKHYDLVKRNADRDDIKVNIACVLNKLNVNCIEALVEEWSCTKIRGILFDFFTPVKGANNEIWLNDEERNMAIDRLLKLKKEYGNFISNSYDVLDLMRPKNAENVTKKCNVPRRIYAIDPMGKRKNKCVMGDKTDCSRCGCIITYLQSNHSTISRKFENLKFAKRMVTQF